MNELTQGIEDLSLDLIKATTQKVCETISRRFCYQLTDSIFILKNWYPDQQDRVPQSKTIYHNWVMLKYDEKLLCNCIVGNKSECQHCIVLREAIKKKAFASIECIAETESALLFDVPAFLKKNASRKLYIVMDLHDTLGSSRMFTGTAKSGDKIQPKCLECGFVHKDCSHQRELFRDFPVVFQRTTVESEDESDGAEEEEEEEFKITSVSKDKLSFPCSDEVKLLIDNLTQTGFYSSVKILIPECKPKEKCPCGNFYDLRDPVRSKWIDKEASLFSHRGQRPVTTYFIPTVRLQCSCQKRYTGEQHAIFNYDGYNLATWDFLIQIHCSFLLSESTFFSVIRAMNVYIACTSFGVQMNDTVLQAMWKSFNMLLDTKVGKAFGCPQCDNAPFRVLFCDGIQNGSKKKGVNVQDSANCNIIDDQFYDGGIPAIERRFAGPDARKDLVSWITSDGDDRTLGNLKKKAIKSMEADVQKYTMCRYDRSAIVTYLKYLPKKPSTAVIEFLEEMSRYVEDLFLSKTKFSFSDHI